MHFSFSQRPLCVSSITCSSSGSAPQPAFCVLGTYNISWLWHGCSVIANVPQPADIIRTQYTKCRLCAPPEDEQVMVETCTGLWFSINWMKSASHWFHYTDMLWCTVSKTLSLIHFCWPYVWRSSDRSALRCVCCGAETERSTARQAGAGRQLSFNWRRCRRANVLVSFRKITFCCCGESEDTMGDKQFDTARS
jgi:hypothetical protein